MKSLIYNLALSVTNIFKKGTTSDTFLLPTKGGFHTFKLQNKKLLKFTHTFGYKYSSLFFIFMFEAFSLMKFCTPYT